MKTSLSWLALELAKSGAKTNMLTTEMTPAQTNFRTQRRIKQANVLHVVGSIRFARLVFKDPKICTSVKYAMAGFTRDLVREARDLDYISFDCCTALQRALDY